MKKKSPDAYCTARDFLHSVLVFTLETAVYGPAVLMFLLRLWIFQIIPHAEDAAMVQTDPCHRAFG